jgi:hypothetical protein
MTSTLAASNERALIESTVAFLIEHLGHRISTYNRHRDKRCTWIHAHIDARADRAYEPYVRPWCLTGPDTDAYGPSHSIHYVFAAADELTCTDCHVNRNWQHAHAAALAELATLAAPYLSGRPAAPGSGGARPEHDACRMAHLIATLTD